MRKYLFAAVAAGGLLLLGAAPAHADERPAPGMLGGLLDPAGGLLPADGLTVDPLGDTPLVDVDPGDNTPSVVPTLPAEGTTPAARTGLGGGTADRPKPAASPSAAPSTPVGRVRAAAAAVRPVALAGLLPDGRASAPDPRESGLPLLGGLLGGEPVHTLPADAGDPGLSGMPAGGSDVPPPAEEPAGDEAGGREFSDGRPVAGVDPDYT